ncbi:galactose-specific lectin nattectin-like, partial [Scomber scombrus]
CHVCPPGWTQFGNHCYMFNHVEKDWADAEHACTSHGGNLASLPNTKVYNFIRAIIHASTGKHTITWVGGYDATKKKTLSTMQTVASRGRLFVARACEDPCHVLTQLWMSHTPS